MICESQFDTEVKDFGVETRITSSVALSTKPAGDVGPVTTSQL